MLHNQVLAKSKEARAHLCRCSKAAKNSPERDGAKEARKNHESYSGMTLHLVLYVLKENEQ